MNCPICSDEITLENSVNTECNHTFCKKCFWKWTKENNTCPLCRHSILANSEELKEQKFIRQMISERRELSDQIQYFQDKIKWLKTEANRLGIILNIREDNSRSTIINYINYTPSNHTIFLSNRQLNNRRLRSIYNSIRGSA
tara:strand:+ start:2014 stop:2439 length:426 start_codon:yes stop_codon:yes gene_type:complete